VGVILRGTFVEHGYLEMDDNVFAALASRLNPTVAWWRE
jgi:hypothetical protein